MSEVTQISPNLNNTASVNDAVFSVETQKAAMSVISIAEARAQFGKAGMTSQGAGALFRNILGSIGIELGGSQAEHAAHLVSLRAMAAAANDPKFEQPKTGTHR